MKIITTSLCLLFAISYCKAQTKGSIISSEIQPKAGLINHYIYYPPEHLAIPDKMQISVVYQSGKQFYLKTIPMIKNSNSYLFSFRAPDSTAILIFSVGDSRKKIIDNNNEAGYILKLLDREGKPFIFENVMLAGMLRGYVPFFLKLKETPTEVLINLYELSYKLNPELKLQESYVDYLTVLYMKKGEVVKNDLLAYARQMALAKNDETNLIIAMRVYQLLKMDEEKNIIEQNAIVNYPNGLIAKNKFLESFNTAQGQTKQTMIAAMDEYINRFKDSSDNIKDYFYMRIIAQLIEQKEWDEIKKYESLFHEKLNLASLYNSFAWKLSGELIDNPGNNLDNAKILSRKSLDYTEVMMKTSITDDLKEQELKDIHNTYADTYALILYKLGQYDSAFSYQDGIYQQGDKLDAGGIERYAIYSEKVKGSSYARQVIEQQLLSGVNSPVMLKQLQSIYKQLNLPMNELNKLQEKSNLLSKQKTAETIKTKFGTLKAKNIELKNILGETVSLSSFKNKVVVLDFWATWCMPCRASFPAMQELLNKYKDDNEVVFLYIDVWENKTAQKMQEIASKFIKDNNYSFNVLLDVNDKVVKDFKVDAIPAKFIINKKGEIVFMGESSNIAFEIENAKN
jgi:thiol-disulfide isomerase/thioredoxin